MSSAQPWPEERDFRNWNKFHILRYLRLLCMFDFLHTFVSCEMCVIFAMLVLGEREGEREWEKANIQGET